MFVISKLKSMVRIEPKHFSRPLPEAISDVLNAKLANKVVKDVGKYCHMLNRLNLMKLIENFNTMNF